jgi:hypothetical protein
VANADEASPDAVEPTKDPSMPGALNFNVDLNCRRSIPPDDSPANMQSGGSPREEIREGRT